MHCGWDGISLRLRGWLVQQWRQQKLQVLAGAAVLMLLQQEFSWNVKRHMTAAVAAAVP
jgi:hypothetical protein